MMSTSNLPRTPRTPRACGLASRLLFAALVIPLTHGCGSETVDIGSDIGSDIGPEVDGWTFLALHSEDHSQRLVAVHFDADSAEDIEVRDMLPLGSGARTWTRTVSDLGIIVQTGNVLEPGYAWLTRVESGEPLATRVRLGEPRKLSGAAFTPSGDGALLRTSNSYPSFPGDEPWGTPDCGLEWVRYDAAHEPVERIELEAPRPLECPELLPSLQLSPAGDLAVWQVWDPEAQSHTLRATTIVDGLPGPVVSLASFAEDAQVRPRLRIDDDKITYFVASDGGVELAVHDRLALDEAPAHYPLMTAELGANAFQTDDYILWRDAEDNPMLSRFDGLVLGAPSALVGPSSWVAWVVSEDELRFVFQEEGRSVGVARATGLAGPEPFTLTTLTEPIAESDWIRGVMGDVNGWTIFERKSEDQEGSGGLELVGPGPEPTTITAIDFAPNAQVALLSSGARPGRVLVSEFAPRQRVHLVDTRGAEPSLTTLVDREASDAPSTAHDSVLWTGGARYALIRTASTIERVFIGGGQPELALDLDGETLVNWWSISEL